uniref:TGF-beta propeptide domain-containing protein n=1 Tax=Leptobrachium leishanense TaxID=445787 RepID=A0A8C5MMA2_9ANUR
IWYELLYIYIYIYIYIHIQPRVTSLGENEEQGCRVCKWRKQSKDFRLENIKSLILSKLRLKHPPNITLEVVNQLLPKAPPLQQILDQHEFQGDSFQHNAFLEEDEYHATTETVISMAQESKFIFLLF